MPIHGLDKPQGGQEVLVIGRVVGLEDGRHGVKPLHQQPHLIVDAEIQRSHQAGLAPLPQPGGRRLEQGRGHVPVRDRLEEPEEAGFRAVTGVMEPIDVG